MTWEQKCLEDYWHSICGTWQRHYFKRYYMSQSDWLDGTTRYWRMCKEAAPAGSRILEIGAGPSNRTTEFLSSLGEVHGVDVDSIVKSNIYLTTAEVIDGEHLPYPDAFFDLCISDFVVEHIRDPIVHLSEVRRVLRPGGSYLFRTPCRWHYVALVARLTPHWFHRLVANATRNLPEETHDPYPTVYAMNSRPAIRRLAAQAGLEVATLEMVESDPSYGNCSRALYLTFMAYERLVNSGELLASIRANIFARLLRRAE